ncbi:LysM peptidoglycan-binding domain-containing protein [Streptomyces sp. NPDC059008]|uniref:LysM peptidoglycan-binding domain-containing protein n=1 Tax=Streptomyces sp. NPDC059008 TaxID=3346693 RepID=UPI00367626E2
MAHPTPGPVRATGRLLRALLGLVVLLALVGGVPFMLLALGHQPTELTGGLDALLRPDDGTLFLVVLTLIGWAGWGAFTLSAVIELVAVLRRRSAPRLKGLGGLQSFAGFLIGGLVLLAPTVASAATPQTATAAVTAPHTTAEGHQVHRADAPSTPDAADTSAQAGPQHTVTASREELWDLAERYLGRGERWRDIATLNPQYPHLATSGAHRGMVLNLPADARISPPAQEKTAASSASAQGGSHAEAHETTYTVEAGDSLTGIADEQLGDADRWHDIYARNRDTISDPDLIYPGQRVDLPGHKSQPPHADHDHAPRPAPEKPAPHKDGAAPTAPESDSSAGAPDRQAPEHHDSSSTHRRSARPDHSSPTAPAPSSPAPATPDVPAPHGSAEEETAQPGARAADDEHALAPATVWAGAGVLAAALIGTLATRRVLQQRRRKPGHRIPMPEGSAAETERRLRSVQHSGFDLLNAALRALASHLADAGRDLPDLDAVVLHDARIDLHLARQAPPVAPFTAMPGQPHVWTCTAAHPSLSEDHSDMDAPYPALVSLGWDEGGRLVLVDLERIGVLNLTGDAHLAQSMLQGLAVELATASVHGPLEVTVVDATAPGLDDVVPERVARSESLAQVTTQLTAHATDQRRSLTDLGARGLGEARLHEDSGGAWTPHVVLAQDLAGDTAALFDALEAAPRTASAVIVAAPTDVPLPDTAWTLNCGGPEQSVTLPGSGLAIHIQGLDDAVYADAVELLRVAASSTTLPPSPAPAGPATDEDDGQTVVASQGEQPADTSGADGAGLPAEYADDDEAEEAGDEPDTPADHTAAVPRPDSEPVDTSTSVAAGPADTALVNVAQACAAGPAHLTVPLPPETAAAMPDGETSAAAAGAAAPDILLLGPVSLTGATGRYDSAREAPSTELAVFLYLNPDVDHHAISAALWPTGTVNKSMRTSVVSRLRSWLGQDADGAYYFPRLQDTEGHRYRLSPTVTCDWTRFQQFAAAGLNDVSEDGDLALRRALSLVRGRPFSAVDRQRYSWAEPLMQEMCEAVVDVALELSDRLREAGDVTGALWAANRGLLAAEESEPLHRAVFRAHHKAGDTPALREAAARLVRINDQLGGEGVDMDAETAQLLRDLLPRTRQTTS